MPEARALDRYLARIGDPQVDLNLPETADQAVVASLIAEVAMANGGPVAYLTADELVDRAVARVSAVRAVTPHRRPSLLCDLIAYQNGQALGVMGFSAYFTASPRFDPADQVIIDADHMVDGLIGSLFMVRVDRRRQPFAYDEICALIRRDRGRARPHRRTAADRAEAPELVEPREWERVARSAEDVLTCVLHDDDAQLIWLRLQPLLPQCSVLVGPEVIEIRAPEQLMGALPGYRYARQRVHLSTAGAPGPDRHGMDPAEPQRAELSPGIWYAVNYLRSHFTDPDLTLDRAAGAVYMSRYHFSRSFREQTGWRFIDYVTMLRMDEARFRLRETDASVTDIARNVGYRELSHFQRTFKKRFGMSASGYRATLGDTLLQDTC